MSSQEVRSSVATPCASVAGVDRKPEVVTSVQSVPKTLRRGFAKQAGRKAL
jgi:hypothetical protein